MEELKMLEKFLVANKKYYEISKGEILGHTSYTIEVNMGDWKHDHGFIDHYMKFLGYTKYEEQITETTGDDVYSSIHRYMASSVYNDMCKLFATK